MCKSCQSCLESLYWNCCEERFCYDESIAKYYDEDWENGKCYTNHVGSIDSLAPITRQPKNNNNNNLPVDDSNRLVMSEMAILGPDIYKVFAKSMIFKQDTDVKKDIEKEVEYNPTSRASYNGHIGKVTFKNDNNEKKETSEVVEDVKMSDFEIMFQDELYGDHKMFKIEEEEEGDGDTIKSSGSPVVNLNLDLKHSNIADSLPDSLDKRHEKAIDIPGRHISRVDSTNSITRANSAKYLPRTKSSALLSRTDSTSSFTRINSRSDLTIKRVDSMKNLENRNIKNVLARLPQKSASFLSIPDLLNDKEEKAKSSSVFTISGEIDGLFNGEHSQISKMPDTPLIKGGKLPKFFAETPTIGEYKAETSLKSIAMQSPDVIFTEFDYSMPRYYGRAKTIANTIAAENGAQASKSLPDLHEAANEKMSKRLAKLGSKLKPLIIKKQDDATKHNSQQNL